MKKIEAVIRHHMLDDIKEALVSAGIVGITASEVRGYGRQRGHKEIYRGTEYNVDFVPKTLIEVVVGDEQLQAAVDAITNAARTGEVGDGKITITDVVDAVRIRTSERGAVAL